MWLVGALAPPLFREHQALIFGVQARQSRARCVVWIQGRRDSMQNALTATRPCLSSLLVSLSSTASRRFWERASLEFPSGCRPTSEHAISFSERIRRQDVRPTSQNHGRGRGRKQWLFQLCQASFGIDPPGFATPNDSPAEVHRAVRSSCQPHRCSRLILLDLKCFRRDSCLRRDMFS